MIDAESLIIQNRLLSEEVKRRIDQMAAINTVAAAVGQSLDLDYTLETALKAVLAVVGAEAGGISLIDEETQEVVLRAQRGWLHDFVTAPMRVPAGQGYSGEVVRSDSVVVDNDLDGTEEFAVPSFREEQFRAIAMAPMHARGKVIGILSIMSSKPDSFTNEIVAVLKAVADTVGVALDNARLYEESVEQQMRVSAILRSSADGIIATDQHGRIRMVNQTAEVMLNVKSEQLDGVPLREAPIAPQVRDLLLFALSSRAEGSSKSFQAALDSGRVLVVLVSPVYVQSHLAPDAAMDGWVLVLQDVTHLREAEMERARFMQAAAHDMRNPLSVTLNSLTMLQGMVEPHEETAHEIIDIAVTSVNRLRDLIDDLLNLEHIQSGYGFERAPLDLRELLREVVDAVRPMMQAKGLAFNVEHDPALPSQVPADRRWLMRALTNYLDNAAKYTPEGGHVLLRLFLNAPLLHFEVADNGMGISEQAQSRLFERFYRVYDKDHEGISGTGLGLAIVKSVAEAHGGAVYVRSKKKQGSTFGMTIAL